jgi:hypothetical protein
MRSSGISVALRPRQDVGDFVPWKLVAPGPGESCRWQCNDGRWVSLGLGAAHALGCVVVSNSEGRREFVDAYETALALAREWRR